MLSILSIALYQLNALNLPNMYLIYIQLHPSNCNSSNVLHLPNICTYSSNAPHPSTNCTSSIQCSPFTQYVPPYIQCTPSIDQLHFINSMLSIYTRCAPIHPMHSIHPSTALHPFNALNLPKMCPQPSNALHSPFHGIWWILRKRERKILCEQ
jgi:hypothetical protein